MNAPDARITPLGIELIGEDRLEIAWQDGRHSAFHADLLRARCPCATCRQEGTGQGEVAITIGAPLPLLPQRARGSMRLVNVEPVGYYAIRIEFSDGHNTGIYSFGYLRGLDEKAS